MTELWRPTSPEKTEMHAFMHEMGFANYAALHRWSVAEPAAFWGELWKRFSIIGNRGETNLIDAGRVKEATFFPQATLNFAENLLRRRDDSDAIVFRLESQRTERISWTELQSQVAKLSHWLRSLGVQPGDRVAGYTANCPEAIVAMLATATVGGVWTSTSPDFGSASVIERFGQTEPKVLLAVDGYWYNGKPQPMSEKVAEVMEGLPSVEQLVCIPLLDGAGDADCTPFGTAPFGTFLAEILANQPSRPIEFTPRNFNAPLYILYSSGTTGQPKCIVHSIGGTLLQHLKEQRLHSDVRPGDRVFYFTTCGWMMWNWLASALAAEATLLLYDGSPFFAGTDEANQPLPGWQVLWQFAESEQCTLFGTSAKYLDAMAKAGARPKDYFGLESLRTLCSTGSVLAPETFDYVYEAIKTDICLASISGGTDIISCFILGNPLLPVIRGECQCAGLGMDVQVFDDDGHALSQQKGELVCKTAFPSRPVGFWNDPDGSRYHDAYYSRFKNCWHHGDYVQQSAAGGFTVFGRSDATLNPGGVRIGTAEIYRHVEQLDFVVEAIAIGQHWENDVRVVLFVVLNDGLQLDEALITEIQKCVRSNCTARHVPTKVLQVAEIPRTRSGKITELAVRQVVHGEPVKNKNALANPEALTHFANRAELRS